MASLFFWWDYFVSPVGYVKSLSEKGFDGFRVFGKNPDQMGIPLAVPDSSDSRKVNAIACELRFDITDIDIGINSQGNYIGFSDHLCLCN